MKINVKVVTGAKTLKIEQLDKDSYKVWLVQRPVEGKANEGLVDVLAKYFNKPKHNIVIAKGLRSKNKIIEIFE